MTLIGATTENPRFEVNSALLSRVTVYELEPLAEEDVVVLLRRAAGARASSARSTLDDDAVELLALRSGGDARIALGALERAAAVGDARRRGRGARRAGRRAACATTAPATSTTTRSRPGSRRRAAATPDASLYYLATMLEGGEDPRFIARRMVILASEDIGNADPQALVVAVAAAAAVEHVGLPECTYALAQAAIYLSLAPKSNAAGRALGAARELIRGEGARRRRRQLRGAGDYDYPHRHAGHVSSQELMPEGLEGARFYRPDEAEAAFAAALARVRSPAGPRMSDGPLAGEMVGRHAACGRSCASRDRARYLERAAQAVIDEFDDLCLALADRGAAPAAPRSPRSSCSPRSTRCAGSPSTRSA